MPLCEISLDKFQYLTDLKKRAKIIQIINRREGIAMAVKTMTGFTQSEIEFFRELSELKAELDFQNDRVLAKREARKEGLEEGLEEGRAEGRAEGLAKGLAEGLVEGRNEVLDLLEQGLSVDEVKARLRNS